MTTWNAAQIGTFARRGGFAGADVVTAAALALAATGGRDHYHYSDPLVLDSDRWGLWALPTDAFPLATPEQLYGPVAGALALWLLWRRAGRSFEWHDDYGPGGHDLWVELAAAQLASSQQLARTRSDQSFAGMLDLAMARARALRARLGG